jgi:hypothetical protein
MLQQVLLCGPVRDCSKGEIWCWVECCVNAAAAAVHTCPDILWQPWCIVQRPVLPLSKGAGLFCYHTLQTRDASQAAVDCQDPYTASCCRFSQVRPSHLVRCGVVAACAAVLYKLASWASCILSGCVTSEKPVLRRLSCVMLPSALGSMRHAVRPVCGLRLVSCHVPLQASIRQSTAPVAVLSAY